MRSMVTTVCLLILVLLPAPAGAQSPAEVPTELSLREALELARQYSPAYLQATNDMGAADWRVRQGWAEFLPNLSASMSAGGGTSRTVTGEDDFGVPVELPDPIEHTSSSTSQGISMNMTLFDGGANWHRYRGAEAEREATAANMEERWTTVRAEVVNAYNEVLRTDRLVQLQERLLASSEARLEDTRERLRLVAASPEDVLGAEVEVASTEQDLQSARGEARKARLRLLEVIGVAADSDVDPTTPLPDVFDPTSLPPDSMVARALRSSPAITGAEASLEVAERNANASRGSRWPSISAGVSYGRSIGLSNYGALTEFNPRNSSTRFNFSASLPLFDRFQRNVSVAQADAGESDARHQLRAARLQLEQQVRSALIDLENAYSGVTLAERSAELANERLELAQEKFRLGSTTFVELQSVIDQAAQAEQRALAARFTFETARVSLERLIGDEVGR